MLALCCSGASDVSVAANQVPIDRGQQGMAPVPAMTCEARMSARSAARSSRGWQLCCTIRTTSMDGGRTRSAAWSARRASGTRGAFAVTWLASTTCRRTFRAWSAVASIPTRLILQRTCGPAMPAVCRRTGWYAVGDIAVYKSRFLNDFGCRVMKRDLCVWYGTCVGIGTDEESAVETIGEFELHRKQCSAHLLGWNICWYADLNYICQYDY